jgi:hypothetical protein
VVQHHFSLPADAEGKVENLAVFYLRKYPGRIPEHHGLKEGMIHFTGTVEMLERCAGKKRTRARRKKATSSLLLPFCLLFELLKFYSGDTET